MVIQLQRPPQGGLSRRAVLAALAGAAVAGRGRSAVAAGRLRIAAVDWAMAETAMALGHAPVAMAELAAFRRIAADQPPDGTVDLGLRGSPNLEALALVAPDLILSSSYYSFAEPQLERIAPVFTRALYVPGEPPFPKVMVLLADLAARLNDAVAGVRTTAAAQDELAALAVKAAPHAGPGCVLMEIGDSRHIRVFGDDSLFGGALQAIGLRNAWSEGTRFAFAAPVPMERLAGFPDARFFILGGVPVQAQRALRSGALWNSLAPVRAGRVHRLADINSFGGAPSALRFAREIVATLEAQA
jgi:iron complex transport system substrate-binding protein